jgi:hypothetical protein
LSVERARASQDPIEIGKALAAYGIFQQHNADLVEAASLLREAGGLLPPADPDALCALSHLNAIERGSSCCSGDMSEALAAALRTLVLRQLPEGLLKTLQFKPAEDGSSEPTVQVELSRQATPEELERLWSVVRHSLFQLRQAISRRG